MRGLDLGFIARVEALAPEGFKRRTMCRGGTVPSAEDGPRVCHVSPSEPCR